MADDLHWADWLVFASFIVITTAVGVIIGYVNRRKATSKDFLQAGSQMHFFPVAMSLQASFLSAIFIVSLPAESYNFGIAYVYIGFSYFIAYPLIGKLFLPVYFNLKLNSAYEYLEIRFSKVVRLAASITFLMEMILYISVAIYTPALTIEQVTSLPAWACILLVSGVCIIYTVVGGMRATIWNDVIQMTVVMAMLAILIGFGHAATGSIREVYEIASNGSRLEFQVFAPDPTARTTFWTQLIGGTFLSFAMYAASQTVIQKCLSTKSLGDAQKSLTILSVTSTVFVILVMWLGIVMYAYYVNCDPQLSGQVEKADQMVPKFMLDLLGDYHGLPGLFIASIFSGALSTVSGGINSMAGATLADMIAPLYYKRKGEQMPERIANVLSRVLVVVFGLVVTAMAFTVPYMGDLILSIALSIFGMVGGPICGVVASGLFLPCVNEWGALVGLLVSLGISMWLGIGTMISGPAPPILPASTDGCPIDNDTITALPTFTDMTTQQYSGGEDDVFAFYKVSTMYYGMISIGICMIVAIIVSAISGVEKDVPHNHIYACADVCCCSCCPASARDCYRCGSLPAEDDEDEIEVVQVRFKKTDEGSGIAGHAPRHPVRQLSYTLTSDAIHMDTDLSPAERRERAGTYSLHTTLFQKDSVIAANDRAQTQLQESKATDSDHSDPDEHFALGSGPSESSSSSSSGEIETKQAESNKQLFTNNYLQAPRGDVSEHIPAEVLVKPLGTPDGVVSTHNIIETPFIESDTVTVTIVPTSVGDSSDKSDDDEDEQKRNKLEKIGGYEQVEMSRRSSSSDGGRYEQLQQAGDHVPLVAAVVSTVTDLGTDNLAFEAEIYRNPENTLDQTEPRADHESKINSATTAGSPSASSTRSVDDDVTRDVAVAMDTRDADDSHAVTSASDAREDDISSSESGSDSNRDERDASVRDDIQEKSNGLEPELDEVVISGRSSRSSSVGKPESIHGEPAENNHDRELVMKGEDLAAVIDTGNIDPDGVVERFTDLIFEPAGSTRSRSSAVSGETGNTERLAEANEILHKADGTADGLNELPDVDIKTRNSSVSSSSSNGSVDADNNVPIHIEIHSKGHRNKRSSPSFSENDDDVHGIDSGVNSGVTAL